MEKHLAPKMYFVEVPTIVLQKIEGLVRLKISPNWAILPKNPQIILKVTQIPINRPICSHWLHIFDYKIHFYV